MPYHAVIVFSRIVLSEAYAGVPGSIQDRFGCPRIHTAQSDIQSGDILLAIMARRSPDSEAIAIIQKNLDKPVECLTERDGEEITLCHAAFPAGRKVKAPWRWLKRYPTRPATFAESISGGFAITGLQAATIVYLPVGLIQGAIGS